MPTRTALGTADDRHVTIGLLHTADVHVSTFGALLERLDPTATARHVVRTDLLDAARAASAGPPGQTPERDEVAAGLQEAVADLVTGCECVLVTCSTLGPYVQSLAAPVAGGRPIPLVRIDRPMARQAVRLAVERAAGAAREGRPRWPGPEPYIVVVAALASAVEPARLLLADCAAAEGIEVGVGVATASGAWAAFEAGDLAGYRDAVDRAIRQAVHLLPDVIVLAQASMAEAADPSGRRHGTPVLASPEPAVREALALAGR